MSFERVEVYGCRDLPILVAGCEEISLISCRFERTMDPGLTHDRRITIRDYTMIMGADNGLSISRGCEEVFGENIRIHGTYISGLHCGGYQPSRTDPPEYGPRRVVLRSIFIENAGERGIALLEGVENVDISGVFIRGVDWGIGTRRYPDYGVGIEIRGLAVRTGAAKEKEPARNIRISDFTIEDTKNSGILFRMVDGLFISDGMIRNVGQAVTATGGRILPDNTLRAIGLGVSENRTHQVRNLSVHDVRIIDDREEPHMNRGIHGYTGQTDWRISRVVVEGARHPWDGADVTGSRDGGQALASLLRVLEAQGIIRDRTDP